MSGVTLDDVWFEYGDSIVLERLRLDVPTGACCAIVGPSGAGKSTLLKLLLGALRPTRGAIRLDGEPLKAEPDPTRGIVYQRYSVYPHLTVRRNIALALELGGDPLFGRLWGQRARKARAQVDALLDAVGLTDAADRYPDALSGGMQQRLALAQAIVREPRILLLDEPFGALDPGTRAEMHRLVRALRQRANPTVFVVTHDLSEAFALADRVVVLDRPRVDPHAPGRYGATVTYDIPVNGRHDASGAAEVIPMSLHDCRRNRA